MVFTFEDTNVAVLLDIGCITNSKVKIDRIYQSKHAADTPAGKMRELQYEFKRTEKNEEEEGRGW